MRVYERESSYVQYMGTHMTHIHSNACEKREYYYNYYII